MPDSLHSLTLIAHSLLRWALVILLALALISALRGWLGRRPWTAGDNKLGGFLTMTADLQLLAGILLYLVSPIVIAARDDMGAAMADASLRYWSVEHTSAMLLAIVFIHVGRARSKRAIDGVLKHKQAAIFFGLAAILVLAMAPWPFSANARPLLPF
jgi:hypothetical protein